MANYQLDKKLAKRKHRGLEQVTRLLVRLQESQMIGQ
jgi:hypothetical protein